MANKVYIEFDGFNEIINKLKKFDGDIKGTTERALKETHTYVTEKARTSIRPHKRTGKTESSLLDDSQVKWAGSIATIYVGFDIKNGGLPSIFLMYGTPRIKKDQKLYDAFYGTQTKQSIKRIQENIYFEELRRMGR